MKKLRVTSDYKRFVTKKYARLPHGGFSGARRGDVVAVEPLTVPALAGGHMARNSRESNCNRAH